MFINEKAKDVGASVVAHDVEVELASNNLGPIYFGDKNSFAITRGTGEVVPERIDDATAAWSYNHFRVVSKPRLVVCGKVPPAIELIAREHEAPSFDRNVSDGGEP